MTPQLYCSHLPHQTLTPVIVVGALGIGGGSGPVVGVNAAGAGVNLPQKLGAAAPEVALQVNLGTLKISVGVPYICTNEPLPDVIRLL